MISVTIITSNVEDRHLFETNLLLIVFMAKVSTIKLIESEQVSLVFTSNNFNGDTKTPWFVLLANCIVVN